MARHPRTAHRHLQSASRLTLFVAVLFTPGLTRDAAAGPPPPPIFLGTFTSAALCSPQGVALSPSGDVYVGSGCIGPQDIQHMERFTAAGAPLGTWTFFPFFQGPPSGVALDGSGNVFVIDSQGSHVHKYSSLGVFISSWETASGPVDIAVNSSGEVFVSISGINPQVQKFANNGTFLATIGGGRFQGPAGIAVDGIDRIYAVDFTRTHVLRFLANGSFDMEFSVFSPSSDVAVGPDGDIYVVRSDHNLVSQYSSAGTFLQSFQSPNGLFLAGRIAISPTGVIYITEGSMHRVTMFQIDRVTSAARTTFGRLKAMYR